MQQEKQAHALEAFLQRFHDETSEGSLDEPEETYHIYPVPGGMVILKEDPEDQSIDATPPQHVPSSALTYAAVLFACMLPLASILFQVYLVFHPPTVTVTLMPSVQTVTFTGMVHMGRLIHPITLSQSATTGTTGRGHQAAKQAQGFITFYNGLFTGQRIASGTLLTGSDGVQLITDQQADVPAGNPPSYGQATVPAHAVRPGERGNIAAYDINQACCANAVLAKNTTPFTGGEDERTFQTVAKRDIAATAAPLKLSLARSLQGALQGQLQPNEQLFLLPCTPTTASDHQEGDEATSVTVTVSQTCSAAAYNRDALYAKAQELLSRFAAKKVGTHYSLFGQAHVTITWATVSHAIPLLTFSCKGVWVYALDGQTQQSIKNALAGKAKQEALHILSSFPGIESASLHWSGFGDDTRVPKDTRNVHLVLIYGI